MQGTEEEVPSFPLPAATVRSHLHPYGWSEDHNRWVAHQQPPTWHNNTIIADASSDRPSWPAERPLQPPPPKQKMDSIRIGTFNVLADCFPFVVEMAIASPRRIPVLVELIEHADMDVLGLNEVTDTILTVILASPVVRQRYQVTPMEVSQPHGVVVLSRLPLSNALALAPASSSSNNSESDRRSPIVATVQVTSTSTLDVCALHTIAHQTEPNKRARERQLTEVSQFLRTRSGTEWILMGDLNLHYKNEDSVVAKMEALDVWAETHFSLGSDQDPGYTFDAATNGMIPRYIPGEKRQMRLDRILVPKGIRIRPVGPCCLWANGAITHDSTRDVFLSDHYGLYVDIAVSIASRPWMGDAVVANWAIQCGLSYELSI